MGIFFRENEIFVKEDFQTRVELASMLQVSSHRTCDFSKGMDASERSIEIPTYLLGSDAAPVNN